MAEQMIIPGYQDLELCKECGGQCCQMYPGSYFPSDFSSDVPGLVQRLVAAFKTGKVAIDLWDGDPRGYARNVPGYVSEVWFLRPRRRVVPHLLDYTLVGDGACIHLTERGCNLPFERRPLNCRMLEPLPKGGCLDHGFGKQNSAVAWMPYQNEIVLARKKYYAEGGE